MEFSSATYGAAWGAVFQTPTPPPGPWDPGTDVVHSRRAWELLGQAGEASRQRQRLLTVTGEKHGVSKASFCKLLTVKFGYK